MADKKRDPHRPSQLDGVKVEYIDGRRIVLCFCGARVQRSIVPHLRREHPGEWSEWVRTFVRLRGIGYPLKRIMRLFRAGDGSLLFSWTVIDRAIRREVESGRLAYKPPPKGSVGRWEPEGFGLEKTTVWSFPRRGDWAVHSGDYRGNWAPQIARNLIMRHTEQGDLVVDAFVGGGTTLIEAWLLRRRSIGVDISRMAIETSEGRLSEMEELAKADPRFSLDASCRPRVVEASALELAAVLRERGIRDGEVKLVCAHPPYLDSLRYTCDAPNDLALIGDPAVYCGKMRLFALQARQVMSGDGVCAVLIGDVRKRGKTIPLGFLTLQAFLAEGFEVRGIVVKMQHKDRSAEFYLKGDGRELLLAHEYLLVLRSSQVRE